MPILKIITAANAPDYSRIKPKYHDENAVHDVVNYVLRPDKTPGHYIGGWLVNVSTAAEEVDRLAKAWGKDFGVRVRHFIITFSGKELKRLSSRKRDQLQILHWIGSYVSGYYGSQYQVVYAVHEDNKDAHLHFAMGVVDVWSGEKYPNNLDADRKFYQFASQFFRENWGLRLEWKGLPKE